MSKAEQRALEAYPIKYAKQERHPKRVQSEKVDTYQPMRTIYTKGYHQAEEDLALTWEDIRLIDTIASKLLVSHGNLDDEGFFKEVLKRFKEMKEK